MKSFSKELLCSQVLFDISALSLSLGRRQLTRNILSNMNENFPKLSGSPAQGDQQDSVDEGIAEHPGNSKQGGYVQANSGQQQCRQGQECGVVLDVKQLNEVAVHDIHDDSADQQLECLNVSEAAPAEEEQAGPILSRIHCLHCLELKEGIVTCK